MDNVQALLADENEHILYDAEQTVSNKQWVLRNGNMSDAKELQRLFQLNPITANILSARDIPLQETEQFLEPKLIDCLPDPFELKSMKELTIEVAKCILKGRPIGIIGDYDVDGATSTALLLRFFKHINLPHAFYIPDRIKEGYGPNIQAFDYFEKKGIVDVITVDCGMTSFEPLKEAKARGFSVYVLDHHEPTMELPECTNVVNPRRFDDESGLEHLAAVGVVFMALVAINRNLREIGFYEGDIAEPNLIAELDLVALGTVCDVVPLIGLNRAFVMQGLKVMRKRQNAGIRALSDVANLQEPPQAWHLGFMLGPRINAGGRIGRSDLGAKLLSCTNHEQAVQYAEHLNELNKQRQQLEQQYLHEAKDQLEDLISTQEERASIFLGSKSWHSGVIGIIASRMKERYFKPALIWCEDADGMYVGSGRSIPGVDLGAIILSAVELGILHKGGGHSQAAGFCLFPEKLEEFQEFVNKRCARYIKENKVTAQLHLDALISTDAIRLSLMEDLNKLAPFGMGNPSPRFAIKANKLLHVQAVGQEKQHIRCILETSKGANITAMAFRANETGLGKILLSAKGKPITLAGTLKSNHWNGSLLPQVIIDDVAIERKF